MDFNIEVRKKQLENLDQLIGSSKNRIQSVFSYLGWTSENVKKEDPLVSCPINLNHRIHPKSWNEHIANCILNVQGYNTKDAFLSESSDNPTQSIYLDRNKKIEIITKELSEKGNMKLAWNGLDPDPKTSDRLLATYSSDERLAFYDYCTKNTSGPPPPEEFTTVINKEHKQNEELSYREMLRQERDSKRRSAKYKSVHLNRKSHTEVMREVIDGQMEEYKEWLMSKEKNGNEQDFDDDNISDDKDKRDYPERPHSSISRNSTHSSSSRSTSRRYKDGRERSRDRRERSRDRSHRSKEHVRRRRSHERYYHRHDYRRSRSRERHSKDRRH